MKIKSFQRFALTVALSLAATLAARAHAFLDHAEPAVGSTVPNAPTVAQIWFTQNVEPSFSAVRVDNSQGEQIDKKDSHVAAGNKKLLSVNLPPLQPGTYTVTWHVVSVDTHKTQGHFIFTVKK